MRRTLTATAIGALIVLVATAATGALPAEAAADSSAITVAWAGGNSAEIQQYQPDHTALTSDGSGRDAGSGHWDDFRNLSVTVEQTRGLIDQVVTVTATGMTPTVKEPDLTRNYLQMFQCYGDPNAADFAQTCQWGGYAWPEVGGSISSAAAALGSHSLSIMGRGGLTFRSVGGRENETVSVTLPGTNGEVTTNTGLGQFFDASTSNEQIFVPVAADGTARVGFSPQSAAAQPYLGCGDTDAAGSRCWLVIVPRGAHSGTLKDSATPCGDASAAYNAYGQSAPSQTGSPLDPNCSMWNDRIVVPLDFADPYASCPAGSAERRVVGSELLSEAMSSWQPKLCGGQNGAAFGMSTNSGDLARAQLLGGQVGMAAVSEPLTADSIGAADPALLTSADPAYGPLANTSLAIGFVLENPQGQVYPQVKLTPRLLAKLLTQSYQYEVPGGGQSGLTVVGTSLATLKLGTILDDPEWAALGNPTDLYGPKGMWLSVGPQGDDALRLLWRYVLADADAVAFLQGKPDPWGTTINPYFLPPASAAAAGGGLDLLSTALDTMPRADQSVFPDAATAKDRFRGLQVDSTTYSPYSVSFGQNAARVARVDTKVTQTWDPNKFSGANVGFWVPTQPFMPVSGGGRMVLGPVTASAAELYRLNTATLALPLSTLTGKDTVASAREFVGYSDSTVAAAIGAQQDDGSGMATLDMTALPSGAYPLSGTVYAAVDLAASGLDDAARAEYAALVDYAAGSGNVRTGARGGLPEGYVPLTDSQITAAHALSAALRSPRTMPEATPPSGPADTAVTVTGAGRGTGAGQTPVAPDPSAVGGPEQQVTAEVTATPTPATPSPAAGALGASLIAGAAGLVASPFLLRRRGVG